MTTALDVTLRAPYKGLAPFDESDTDAMLFFGRERETEIVSANALAARLTVLYGPSGVGKSSLLRAGVVHRLRRASLTEPIAVAYFSSWAGDPALGIDEAVRGALADSFGGDPGDAPGDLVDRLDGWAAALGAQIVVILDQFEEHFLYHEAGAGLHEFLPELVTRPGLRVNVVIGIRDDELARLDVFKAHIPGLFGNYLRLDRMSRDAGRAAIIGPLERFNESTAEHVAIEPALVETVLADVALGQIDGRQGAPDESGIETPYLQLVLQRIWDVERERRSNVLRLSTLAELGGARRIVDDHLARAMAALTPAQQDVAAGMFDHLVTPSGTKIAHGVSDLATFAHVGIAQLQPVLASLAHQRILRPAGDTTPSGDRYEIYHDVLAGAVLDWKAQHEAAVALSRERVESQRRQRRLAIIAGISIVAFALMAALTIYAYSARSTAQAQRERAVHAVQVARVAQHKNLVARRQAQRRADQYKSLYDRYRTTSHSNALLVHKTREQNAELDSTNQQLQHTNTELDSTNQQLHQSNAKLQTANETVNQSNKALQQQTRKAQHETNVATQQTQAVQTKERQTRALELLQASQAALVNDPSASVDDAMSSARIGTLPGTEDVLRAALVADHERMQLPAGGPATQGAYSPDGSRYAVGSSSGSVREYSTTTGTLVGSLVAAGPVASLAWSPDGQTIAVGSAKGTLQLWRPASGETRTLAGLTRTLSAGASVTAVAFAPNGRTFATAAGTTAQLWDASSGLELSTLPHPRTVTSVAYSDDSALILTTADQNVARVWDVATGTLVQQLQARARINAAAFGPKGTLVVTGSQDGTGRIWDTRTGNVIRQLVGHTAAITSVAFSPTGDRVATGSVDGTVRWWTPADGLVDVTRGFTAPVLSVAFSPDGQTIVGLQKDGRAVTAAFAQLPVSLLGEPGPGRGVLFSPDGTRVATVSGNGVRIWEPYGELRAGGIHRAAAAGTAVAFNPSGTVLASGDAGGTVALQRAHGGPLSSFTIGAPVVALSWAKDGTLLAAGADGELHLRAHGRSRVIQADEPIVAAALSADGRVAAAIGKDGALEVWRDGSLRASLGAALGAGPAVALDPTGRLAAAGVGDDVVIVDAETGTVVKRLSGHTDAVTGVQFSPDGRLIASSSRDHDARIWSISDWKLVATLQRHTSAISGVAFSADGRWLATAGAAKAGVWSASGNTVLPGGFLFFARGNVPPITAVAWSPRSWELATTSRDGSVRIVDCQLCGTLHDLENVARSRLAAGNR